MGYYSQLDGTIRIKKDKIKEFKRAVKKVDKEKDVYVYFLEDMKIEKDGTIRYDDNYAKWYACDEWAVLMKPFIEDGTHIEFVGEDGNRWGYHWKDGKVYPLIFKVVIGKTPLS